MVAVIVILSLVAILWLWLIVSPARRVTFRDVFNTEAMVLQSSQLPPVTIIIPARNEAEMLPNTLPSICRQDYPDARVILVDDQSDDDSPRILAQLQHAHPNLKVLNGEPRSEGWMGKNWAVHQGYQQAETDWLLFTDADVVYHPRALRTAMQIALELDLDFLTIMPRVTFGRTIERIGVAGMITLMGLLFPVGRANNPKRKTALGIGMFILTRRSAYEKIGGHKAIRGTIIEDMLLAKVYKRAGCRTHARFTSDLLTTRMYDGWHDLWEGLTKNAYASLDFNPLRLTFLLLLGTLVDVLMPVYLVASLIWCIVAPSSASWTIFALTLWINIAMAIVHSRCTRYLKLPWYYALMMSVSVGLYVLIGAYSAWKHHFGGGHTWKGRRYGKALVSESHG